jgi:phosphate-selective porin
VLGALRGRFVIVGDSILSSYSSPTLRYRGFECIQQRDARRYSVRGAMLEEDKLISSWALELTRIQGEK